MAYSLVAVDFMSEHALHAALTRVASAASDGGIMPLPHILHGMPSVAGALRQMSQARHVGKIVVGAPSKGQSINATGAICVTGGLGRMCSL